MKTDVKITKKEIQEIISSISVNLVDDGNHTDFEINVGEFVIFFDVYQKTDYKLLRCATYLTPKEFDETKTIEVTNLRLYHFMEEEQVALSNFHKEIISETIKALLL